MSAAAIAASKRSLACRRASSTTESRSISSILAWGPLCRTGHHPATNVKYAVPRYLAALIAAVLAVAPRPTAGALDRSIAQADNAWLIVVDDLHINFANTGRLRDLLRTVGKELVRDGDLVELCTTGPSAAVPLTADRELLAAGIKMATGNALKPKDFIGTACDWNEVLYRANTSLETARDALSAFSFADGRRKAIVYVSAGYDVDRCRPSPIASPPSPAGPARMPSRSSPSTLVVSSSSRCPIQASMRRHRSVNHCRAAQSDDADGTDGRLRD